MLFVLVASPSSSPLSAFSPLLLSLVILVLGQWRIVQPVWEIIHHRPILASKQTNKLHRQADRSAHEIQNDTELEPKLHHPHRFNVSERKQRNNISVQEQQEKLFLSTSAKEQCFCLCSTSLQLRHKTNRELWGWIWTRVHTAVWLWFSLLFSASI